VEVLVETGNAESMSATLRDIKPVGEEDIGRMVRAWKASGFLG
jgi:hypothetical protein